ncbi:MAG: TonB-dependent receptor [Pseudomonadota bacterium]
MFYKTALLGAIAASLAAPTWAQTGTDSETTLQTIIVNGSRIDQAATEIGSSVSILTAEDIERLGTDFALDAIASLPGVTVTQNGSFGGSAGVRIRGASSEQTLVVIDGVPVNDPSSPGGGFNFARVDTETIERIEVLKGPQSTLWGTDAIGGVVSIVTKAPEPGFGGSVFGEFGSFNTYRGGASVEAANDQGDLRLALVGSSTDGISKADEDNGNTEEDGYESFIVSAKGGLNLGGDARISADLLWTDATSDFDNSSGGVVFDADNVSETEELSGNLSIEAPLFDGKLANLLLIGFADIERANFNDGVAGFSASGDRVIYRYQGTFSVDERNKIAFGLEREDSKTGDEDTSIDSVFALYQFKPVDVVTLTGSLRRDDHEQFGAETTGRVAAAYNPTQHFTWRASWGQGFKAPTIFQTTFFCCGAAGPNPDLQAETSEAFDFGLDYRSKTGTYEAGITIFDQETENQIDFSFADGGYSNVDQVSSTGVELVGGAQLSDSLRLSGSYTYIDVKDDTGDDLVRVPKNSADVQLAFDPDGPLAGAVMVRYNDVERDANGKVDAWTRVDLTGSYDLNEKVELFARIENLFDEEYQQVLGYGTPDLSGSVGIRVRY